MKRCEMPAHFLERTQAYVCKEGNERLFGERIYVKDTVSSKRKREDEIWTQAIGAEEDVARKLLQKHFPRDYIRCYCNFEKFLQSKRRKTTVEHVPNFTANGWVVPSELLEWRKEISGSAREGRPVSHILIGPPRCGKTQWALSFGRPAEMSNRFCFDALTLYRRIARILFQTILL
ncbi:Putative geminivirus AL1 replication-associated protein, central [Colletotrichum destructivum]|uniref:Geminivirus AL1 replication-associated protein, central n=1 Tax=Colletotrichum destructivum TaxID=34406 RepID=A0AAX4I0Y6_9PEZI|nr:Putative geminivirus AL1 replication-associated protein, central [Colletotrichum destructivum]